MTRASHYVVRTLRAAGWTVALDQFDFTVAEPIRQLTPIVASYETGAFTGSGLGTVTGRGHSRRHQPDASACQYERLRGG